MATKTEDLRPLDCVVSGENVAIRVRGEDGSAVKILELAPVQARWLAGQLLNTAARTRSEADGGEG